MHYIHLNDDTYILNTVNGAVTLTRRNFNFNKIKNMIKQKRPEEEILPLLTAPELPEGIYQFYLVPTSNQVFYHHLEDTATGIKETFKDMSGDEIPHIPDEMPRKLLGVYTSVQEIILDWPEYTI